MERVNRICDEFGEIQKKNQIRLNNLEKHGIEKLPKKQMKEILEYLETMNAKMNQLLDEFAAIIGCYVDAVNQLHKRVNELEQK